MENSLTTVRFRSSARARRPAPSSTGTRTLGLRASGTFALLLQLGACATYRPKALVPEDELVSLRQTPPLGELHIQRLRPGEAAPTDLAFDPSDGLDEAELVAVALTVNPELRSKRLEIGEASALLVSARVWPNPELSAFVRPGVDGTPTTGLGLDLLFALLRPDERPARLASAEARVATTRAEVAAEELRVVSEVRRARIRFLATDQAARLLEQELTLRDEAVTLVQRQRELGEATEIGVLLVELDRTGVQRRLRESQYNLERERRTMNQLVGVPPSYELPLTGLGKPLEFIIYDDLSEDEIDRRLLAARFDLRARAFSYQQAEEDLRLAIALQFPGMSLGPSFEKDVEGSQGLGLAGSFEIPLFDRNQGEIARKAASRERARAEYTALLHELRAQAFEARASLKRAREEVEVGQRDVVPLIERTGALFEGALRARELTVFEWITARGRALEARGNLVEVLVRYTSAVVDLESATGMPLGSASIQQNTDKDTHQ